MVLVWTACNSVKERVRGAPEVYVETIRGTDVTFEMTWVPEGNFWIGKTEVTWDEYMQYFDPDMLEKAPPGVDVVAKPSRPLPQEPFDRGWGLGRRPAVGISRNAAKTYCKWLSLNTGRAYRLPSEAEWKLACEEGSGPVRERAWCAENSADQTHEVATKKPNARGIHDMLGNVWEFCQDNFDGTDRAVLRGGSWKDAASKLDRRLRIGFDDDWVMRDPNIPPGVWWVPDGDHIGFRVVRTKED